VNRFSIVIVGGGPAGLATALFLAARSSALTDRIVVLERERYPREKTCAGAIGARADRALWSIGVAVDVPSAPIDALALRTAGRTVVVTKAGAGRVVRRVEFDHALARVAQSRGIAVRDGVRVLSVDARDDGVTVRTSEGDISADAVVGADGVAGIVRRALGFAETTHRAQALEIDTERVSSDLDPNVVLFDLSRPDLPGYYWDFPTVVDGRSLVSRGVYYLKTQDPKQPLEIETVLAAELSRRGLDPSRYPRKRYAERGFHVRGAVARGRILLVGEAAGIDPVTGEGIAQAIQYGAAAGSYLSRKLSDRDVEFGDWSRAIRNASIGRDLGVRAAAVNLAYGRHRPMVERFVVETPELLEIGLAHFAGRRYPKRAALSVALGALGLVAATARGFLGGDGLSTSA
jgi:flavin-dependent dehydrogenase